MVPTKVLPFSIILSRANSLYWKFSSRHFVGTQHFPDVNIEEKTKIFVGPSQTNKQTKGGLYTTYDEPEIVKRSQYYVS